jgi:hypothetical protein
MQQLTNNVKTINKSANIIVTLRAKIKMCHYKPSQQFGILTQFLLSQKNKEKQKRQVEIHRTPPATFWPAARGTSQIPDLCELSSLI